MARTNDSLITRGIKGAIGKELVYRTTKNGTFACKYPDMSGVIPSKNQTKGRARFAEAVKFAQSVLKDPEKSTKYRNGNNYSVYHGAIKDYLNLYNTEKKGMAELPEAVQTDLLALSLSDQQLRAVKYIIQNKKLTNGIYQKMNNVSKATATRHLQELVALEIIQSNHARGAGAYYNLGSKWDINGLI